MSEHSQESGDRRGKGHEEGPGYSAVRRSPATVAEPRGFGPGGYTPRESEQEFRAAYDERSQGAYGQRYGSGSADASFGRGLGPGSHRGRGPRGFVRSDVRIIEDISERMSDDAQLDAGDISVSVQQGVASLEGSVPERWMKYRAEDIAAHCGGVADVVNRITVAPATTIGR